MIFRVQRYFIYYLNKLSQNEGTSWVKLSNFFFLINCSTVNYKLTFLVYTLDRLSTNYFRLGNLKQRTSTRLGSNKVLISLIALHLKFWTANLCI